MALGGHSKGTASGATSATTGSFTTTSGSVLIAGCGSEGSTISSFTENKGNGNATLLSTELAHNNATSRMGFWQNITGGSGHTVTVNITPANNVLVFAMEATSMATTGADDGATRQADAATPYTSTTIATTVATDFLAGMIISDEFAAVTYTAGNSFTMVEQEESGTNITGELAYRIVAATGSYESSFTMTGASGNSKGVWIAAFEEATGGVAPSVSDTVTLAENITMTMHLKNTAANDTATVTEGVTMHMPIHLRMEKLS